MTTQWKHIFLVTLFAHTLIPIFGQTTSPQATGIDPVVLAKANAGDAASQVLVGDSVAAGNRQARNAKQLAADYQQAAEWYRKAAEKGDIGGETRLAALYRDGRGLARDMAQAAEWYRKAAEQGDATAQATLGVLYSMGQGVPHDDVEAYYWLDLAASAKGPNQEKYAANRQMIGTHITADELASVEERAAKWLAEHPR